jgi:pyocin large subunit-like protein
VAFTAGFASAQKLTDHFDKHKSRLRVVTEEEYLTRADDFMGGPLHLNTLECRRNADGDLLRFNPFTQEFGVLTTGAIIRTYHIRKTRRDAAWFAGECAKAAE